MPYDYLINRDIFETPRCIIFTQTQRKKSRFLFTVHCSVFRFRFRLPGCCELLFGSTTCSGRDTRPRPGKLVLPFSMVLPKQPQEL